MALRQTLLLSGMLHLGLVAWAVVQASRSPHLLFASSSPLRGDAELVVSPVPPSVGLLKKDSPKSNKLLAKAPLRVIAQLTPGAAQSQRVTSEWELPMAAVVAEGNSAPEYPEEAERHGWEGEVRVRLWLDQQGLVHRVEIAERSGHELLDQAVIQAASTWRFPAEVESHRRERLCLVVPVKFTLD